MVCEKCGAQVQETEIFTYGDSNLCEDCYMEIISVPKTCNPMSVRSARLTREMLGQKGVCELLPIQEQINL